MNSLENIPKSDLKLLVEYELSKYNDPIGYDTLEIFHITKKQIRANRSKKNPKWKYVYVIAYKVEKGDFMTGFGDLNFDIEGFDNLLRDIRLKMLTE